MKNIDTKIAISAAVGVALFGAFLFALKKVGSSVPGAKSVADTVEKVTTGKG